MNTILEFKNVSYFYENGKDILKDISVQFEKGKFYTIVGPSGSGKTTFLSLACGLDSTKNGEILYKGESLEKIGLNKFRNKYAAIIFQNFNLLNYMTALQNVVSAMDIKGISIKNKKEYALDMLEKVGLTKEQANQKILTLSGGQQQRVAIARALCSETEIIFADEPTGNLDENTSDEVISLFKNLVLENGKTLIMVTHNKKIAEKSDKVFIVKNKEIKII